MYTTRAGEAAAAFGKQQQQQDEPGQQQQPGDVVKPGVSTRSGATTAGGLASGASRRALGDITNNRGAKQLGGKQGQGQPSTTKVPTTRAAAAAAAAAAASSTTSTTESNNNNNKRGFGLASAAPPPVLYQQTVPALPRALRGSASEGVGVVVEDAESRRQVEDMELIQEADEIDMHIEDPPEPLRPHQQQQQQQQQAQQQPHEELGTITKDLQGMTIKHPMLMQPAILAPGVDDIDAADADNPLACVDYVEQQYMHYREKECRPGYDPSYMGKQPYINVRMRAILVDWLVEVHYKFKCCPETLYLTVNLIDRFLDRKQVPRPKLQLVGVTAFLIACKYEEIYPPEVKELVYMTDGAYTRKQIIDMEAFMLATLKFQVTVCTTHCFLVRFLKAGHADNKLYFLASYICERTLQEVDILCFLPSMVAAAAVYLSRKNCGLRPWSPTLQHYTKYTEEALLPCLRVLSPWLNTRSQSLQAIRKKYGSVKFMMVSGLELEGVGA